MSKLRWVIAGLLVAAVTVAPIGAAEEVPFKATWQGITVAADLSGFPIVEVLASGSGQATQLGRFTMDSPHFSDVFTGHVWGEQNFTAANGDTLTATFDGFLAPVGSDGTLAGTLEATITGGTGRFEGATGSYGFEIVAVPLADGSGYASSATITGTVSSVGASR